MIRIIEQICAQTMISEDRLRLQSMTIKMDGKQFRQLIDLYEGEVDDARFHDLPEEDWPKVTDILAAAISRGLDVMHKEK